MKKTLRIHLFSCSINEKAHVVKNSLSSLTLFVQYISGAVFAAGASLTATGSKTATVASSNDSNGKTPIGFGSIVSIEDGIYYIKRHFVTVKAKTIVLI